MMRPPSTRVASSRLEKLPQELLNLVCETGILDIHDVWSLARTSRLNYQNLVPLLYQISGIKYFVEEGWSPRQKDAQFERTGVHVRFLSIRLQYLPLPPPPDEPNPPAPSLFKFSGPCLDRPRCSVAEIKKIIKKLSLFPNLIGVEIKDETNVDARASTVTKLVLAALLTMPKLANLKVYANPFLEVLGDPVAVGESDTIVARLKTLELKIFGSRQVTDLNNLLRVINHSSSAITSFHSGSSYDEVRHLSLPSLNMIKYGIDKPLDDFTLEHASQIQYAVFTLTLPIDFQITDALVDKLKFFPNIVRLTLCPTFVSVELDVLLISRIAQQLPKLKLLMEIREASSEAWRTVGRRFVFSLSESRTRAWTITRKDGSVFVNLENSDDYNFGRQMQGVYLTARQDFVKIPNECWN